MDPAQQKPAGGARTPQARKTRLVLLMVGGLLALLCLGGGGVAFVAYRQATEPDRSAPDVAVDNYLRAYLVDRDDALADQYTCENQTDSKQLEDLRAELVGREQRFKTTFAVTWAELRVSERDDTADVSADIRFSAVVDGFQQSDLQTWRFELTNQDGWRVCRAARS